MPEIIIIAGPNGAGKTSFARYLIGQDALEPRFLNADDIAREMATRGVRSPELELLAGRELLRQLAALITERKGFVIETTLTGRSYATSIPKWRAERYRVVLHYLRLPHVDASIRRVQRRIAAGGHGIPESVLRRRFGRSLWNFTKIYKPIVDEWHLYDSIEGDFVLVDEGSRS